MTEEAFEPGDFLRDHRIAVGVSLEVKIREHVPRGGCKSAGRFVSHEALRFRPDVFHR